MKRKVFTLLMAFLTTVGNAVWGQEQDARWSPNINSYNIDKAKVEALDLVYDGTNQVSKIASAISIWHDNSGKHEYLDSKYYSVSVSPTEIKGAKTYSVQVTVKGKDSAKGELTETISITVSPKEVTAKAGDVKCEVNGTPDYSNVTFDFEKEAIIKGDIVKVSWSGTPSGTVNTSSAGEYNVTYTDATLDNTNYKLKDDPTGKVIVEGKKQTDLSEAGYTIDNAKLKDFTYQAKDLTNDVKKAIEVKDKDGKVLEASNYEVTINPEKVLNAGEYKVTVTGKGDYSSSIEATFIVAKAKLSATASEVKVAVNGTPDFSEVTFTFNEGSKPYTSDEVSVKLDGEGPTVDTGTEGSQEYTYKNVELTGSAKDNYELTEVKGTITVGDSGEEPGTSTDITTGYVIENDKLKDLVYKAEDLDVEIIVKNSLTGEVLDAKNYSVEITPKQIYDAGKYTVKVTGKDGYSGSFEGSFEVAQKEVIAAASTIECEISLGLNYKEEVEFTFDTNPEFGGVYEKDKDQVWVVWNGDKPLGEFNLGAEGSYKVTYSDATLGGDRAKNYKLAADPTGNIVVGKPQGGDDEDKTDISNLKASIINKDGKIFVYNGNEQDYTYLIQVKEDGEEGIVYNEKTDYTVSVLDENGEDAFFKNAGDYTVQITPVEGGRLTGNPITLDEKLPIYPKEVKVVAKDIHYTIGDSQESVNMEGLLSIEEGGICDVDAGLNITVTASNTPLLTGYTLPGVYTFLYKQVEVLGLGDNYTVAGNGEVDGLIYVMKNITDEDPMNPGNMEEGNDSDHYKKAGNM